MMGAMLPRPALIALALAVTAAACGGPGPAPATTTPTRSPTPAVTTTTPASPTATSPSPGEGHGSHEGGPELDAYLALCEVSSQVEAGDLERAEATFHDEVHEALHELAERLETTDRAASAALLVAKARVEEDLERDPIDAGALAKDVRGLLRAMADALAAAGDPPPACPAETAG
jgi:hypothetical protein